MNSTSELLIMVPFVAVMAIGMFRLDEHLFASKDKPEQAARKSTRPVCGVDEQGRPILADPDGRVHRGKRK